MLLMLCKGGPMERPHHDFLKLLGAAVLIVGLIFALPAIFGRNGFYWRGQMPPLTRQPVPLWAQRSIVALMIGAYIYWGILPLIFGRLRIPLPQLLSKVFGKHHKIMPGK